MSLICNKCGSKKIMELRIDSDWTSAGTYYIVNDDKFYTKEELEYDIHCRPDINLYHCLKCDTLFGQDDLLYEED